MWLEPPTIAYVKDATLTVRMQSSLRRRIETLARKEGRSLSNQVGHLIELGIRASAEPNEAARRRDARPLSGFFMGTRVPSLSDFRETRAVVSASISRRGRTP